MGKVIYQDDCICPDCIHYDKEKDICKMKRRRYPADGCFDFTSEPGGDNALIKMLKIIKEVRHGQDR